jgi:hypothetical protein
VELQTYLDNIDVDAGGMEEDIPNAATDAPASDATPADGAAAPMAE